ncbi:hypothetical protein RRG08_031817 [Elysia crispata]|uniref:Uncharacterized protein n=1 Tax=Elysia crispata TaxID=231223 RepID=A0AAE0Y5R4_9GAST|nr:hypothetical protein RRG08_031817 [Elysia crispata]
MAGGEDCGLWLAELAPPGSNPGFPDQRPQAGPGLYCLQVSRSPSGIRTGVLPVASSGFLRRMRTPAESSDTLTTQIVTRE